VRQVTPPIARTWKQKMPTTASSADAFVDRTLQGRFSHVVKILARFVEIYRVSPAAHSLSPFVFVHAHVCQEYTPLRVKMRETCEELLTTSGHTEWSLNERFRRLGRLNHCSMWECCNPDSKYGGAFECRPPHESVRFGDPCLDMIYVDKHYGQCCAQGNYEQPGHEAVCKAVRHPRILLGNRRAKDVYPIVQPDHDKHFGL